jgi:dihydrofolate reductase
MSKVVLYMSMSVDGFIAGPDDGPGRGLGVGGERLHDWLGAGETDPGSYRPAGDGPSAAVFDEMMATGAVITGRRTFDHAGGWAGDHHGGVPVFVLTHDVPDDPPPGSVRYVTDVRECAAQARAAAGDADVMVHGAGAAQALLRIGELDELELHVVPVLLGQGRRLFDHLPAEHIELDLLRRLTPDDGDLAHRVMHLRYRVRP